MTATSTETRPWQHQIIDQFVGENLDGATHIVVNRKPDGTAQFIDAHPDENTAVAALDHHAKALTGSVDVVDLNYLHAWLNENPRTPTIDHDTARTITDELDQELNGPDPTEHAAANLTAPTNDDDPGDALFDTADYTDPRLTLDKVDEKDVDKIRVEFAGSVMLDRRNPDDVQFMRRLKLGQTLELRIAATCHSKKTGYTTGKEGDLDAIVFTGGLKVDTLYNLTPEQL